MKTEISSEIREDRKQYVEPKLTTHGDAARLTQHSDCGHPSCAPGSNLFGGKGCHPLLPL